MSRKFTQAEEQFLIDNYPQNDYEFCAKALGKALDMVSNKVKRMKLKRIGFFMTDEQKQFILNNYKSLSINEICEQANVKHFQVYTFLSRQGIKLSEHNPYTDAEEQIIRDNFSTLSNDEIGLLINRTGESVHSKAQTLKLKRTRAAVEKIRERICSHTYFSKGHIPHNTKTDGEITIRVFNGKSQKHVRISMAYWVPLQIFNWEQVNGSVPEGMVLRCISGDTLDCMPNNWELISRSEHLEKNAGRDTLEDKYITNLLAHKNRELRPMIAEMPELIELKRNQIKMRRTINELN